MKMLFSARPTIREPTKFSGGDPTISSGAAAFNIGGVPALSLVGFTIR